MANEKLIDAKKRCGVIKLTAAAVLRCLFRKMNFFCLNRFVNA